MEIIEKVRIVTFTGTEEQVKIQEGGSRPFGVLNKMEERPERLIGINKCCQITVEDATGVNLDDKSPFEFSYTNYQGETSNRRVIPIQPRFEVNKFYGDKPLWLLKAYDLGKGAIRYFDMKKIRKKHSGGHYGLSIGDRVRYFSNHNKKGVVVRYAGFDNNGCYVLEDGLTEIYKTFCEYWERDE